MHPEEAPLAKLAKHQDVFLQMMEAGREVARQEREELRQAA